MEKKMNNKKDEKQEEWQIMRKNTNQPTEDSILSHLKRKPNPSHIYHSPQNTPACM